MVKSLTAAEKSGRESRKLHVLGHEKSKNPKIDKDFSSDSLISIIYFGGKNIKELSRNNEETSTVVFHASNKAKFRLWLPDVSAAVRDLTMNHG